MNATINIRGQLFDFATPTVMGILNITPDSFYPGSRAMSDEAIVQRARQMLEDGAAIIDVGAFSTRPGADEVSESEERARLVRALGLLRRELPAQTILSVDTYRADIAKMAVEELGADIINDVSEGGITGRANVPLHEAPKMFATVARLNVPYILMSVKSTIPDMLKAFAAEIQELHALGQKDIILDPGFGFGKTVEQNYAVLRHLDELSVLELPILAGVSRKRMIQQPLGVDAASALNGTTVVHTLALAKGASILRAHDVKEAVETVKIWQASGFNTPNHSF